MGKYLVKFGNVDFLDSQRLRQTAPLGRWGSHSGFLQSSSSDRCNKYICGREWGVFPAVSANRCTRSLPYLVSVPRALAAASRWGHKAAGTSQSRWDTWSSRLMLENHQSCLQTISRCSKVTIWNLHHLIRTYVVQCNLNMSKCYPKWSKYARMNG